MVIRRAISFGVVWAALAAAASLADCGGEKSPN